MAFPRSTPGPQFLLVSLIIMGLGAPAHAVDMPKRKSGLWEITTSMEGMPKGMGPIQHCIDQSSDNLMQQNAEKFKQQCSTNDIKQQGDRITVHSVCKLETTKNTTTTTTMDAVFTGAFDSAYRGDIQTRFIPPLHGMAESKMAIAAKWLGACKPGQKPGDIVMPGKAGNFNLEDAMKKHNAQKP